RVWAISRPPKRCTMAEQRATSHWVDRLGSGFAGRQRQRRRRAWSRRREEKRPRFRPGLQELGDRVVLAVTFLDPSVGTWVEQGPRNLRDGQSEGFTASAQIGAVAQVAIVPNSTTAYAATSSGGVWKTSNIFSSSPNWRPTTDKLSAYATT